ncbi:hypothetical protein ACIPZC_25560 [Pseudomonas sp. NPDC089743]|uniref:hypothetical protein n=1 Tax=Pseudomonas sp. NPDC089743 TaxID=3364471 RepID=UPI00381CE9E9
MGDLGNFGWLFQSGTDAMITSLVAMGAKTEAFATFMRPYASSWPFLPLAWFVLKLCIAKPDQKTAGMFLVSLLSLFLLSPAAVNFPGRASLQMTQGQAWTLKFVMPVYESLVQIYRTKDNDPSALMIADLTEREISPFVGSDLANLMKDYKQYCEPGPDQSKGVPDTTWQAVGLRGGGALGVPDSQVSIFTSATADKLSEQSLFSWFGPIRKLLVITDTYEAGNRRAEGRAALEKMTDTNWPKGRRYLLPNESGWKSRLSGGVDESTVYLNPWEIAKGSLADPALREEPTEINNRYFVPENCYEAYQAAQAGAEEGYKAVGEKIRPSNLAPDTEASVVAGIRAWSNIVNKSLDSLYTGAKDSWWGPRISEGSSEAIGALNEVKGALSTVDLAAKLPLFVYLTALGQALLIHIFPLIALLACVLGGDILLYWFRLVVFTFTALFFSEGILYGVSGLLSSISYAQAATALSYAGTSLDLDGLRGALAGGAGFVIMVATYVAATLLKVQSLPGKGENAASFSQLGSIAASVAGTVMGGVSKIAALKTAGLKQELLRAKIEKTHNSGRAPGGSPSIGGNNPDSPRPSRETREWAGQRLARPASADQSEGQQKNRTSRAERADRRRSPLNPSDGSK